MVCPDPSEKTSPPDWMGPLIFFQLFHLAFCYIRICFKQIHDFSGPQRFHVMNLTNYSERAAKYVQNDLNFYEKGKESARKREHIVCWWRIPLVGQLNYARIILSFVSYPSAMAYMDVPQIWSFLFFFMLVNLAISSGCANIQCIASYFMDTWPSLRERKMLVFTGIATVLFLWGNNMAY